MIRTSLAALVALSMSVSAGEWRYWTWPGQAQMAASTGRTAWFATTGGVFEWNLDANTTRLHQRSDGLPTTDIASILTQKNGSVWAIAQNGMLAVKRPNEPTWQARGTYSAQPSPWSFNPRVAVMHRNARTGREILVLGGPKGLTFFPTDTTFALDWTDQFASLGKREVRAISIDGDTLWVGLMGGMVRIVPPWDSLGNNRAFISDPKRWTVLASSETTDDYSALFPVPGAMTWQPNYTFGAKTVLLNKDSLFWNGKFFNTMPNRNKFGSNWISAVHAYDNGTELLVSSMIKSPQFEGDGHGPFVITSAGEFRTPPIPSNGLSVPPPPVAVIRQGMDLTIWSSNQVLSWRRDQPEWKAPWKGAFESTIDIKMNFYLTDNPDMNTFARGSDGSIWAGGWGPGLWGALPTPGTDSLTWKNWNHTNSCLEGAGTSPSLQSYITINSLVATDSAVWGATYRLAGDSAQLFSVPLDGKSIKCWKFANPNTYNSDVHVGADRIWIATHDGLRSFRRPNANTTRLQEISKLPGDFRRVKPIVLDGTTYLVALQPTSLSLVLPLPNKDSVVVNSLLQKPPLASRQEGKRMAIDGLGHLWVAGIEGIDILSIQPGERSYEFRKVREVGIADGMPSNLVYGITMEPSTGMVLVTTDRGIGLWNSPYRPLSDRLDSKKARVYPNPLRTRTHGELVVDGATASSHFYLHAADGSLVVHLGPSEQAGGYFRWRLPGHDRLRPGVYRWTLKDANSKMGGPLLIAE